MGIKKDIIVVAIGIAVIWFGVLAIFGTSNPFYVVSSGSMIPELQVYDIIVVNAHTSFEEIKVGDIIVFDKPVGEEKVIVHRVASIIDDDPRTIRTKGDANPASIPGTDFPITEKEYIGHVDFKISEVGYITQIIRPPINWIIVAIVVGIVISWEFSKKKKKEQPTDVFDLDENNEESNEDQDSFDKLDEIPKDEVYSESAEKVNSDEKIENDESETDSKDKTDEKT